MATVKTAGRNTQQAAKVSNAGLFAALAKAEAKIIAYGLNTPLYAMMAKFGTVSPVNTLDTAFENFDEIREGLQPGEVGYSYSERFGSHSLAMRAPDGSVVFASLHHDKDANAIEAADLVVCEVKAIRDFKNAEGDVIIPAGKTLIKAVPTEYASSLKAA